MALAVNKIPHVRMNELEASAFIQIDRPSDHNLAVQSKSFSDDTRFQSLSELLMSCLKTKPFSKSRFGIMLVECQSFLIRARLMPVFMPNFCITSNGKAAKFISQVGQVIREILYPAAAQNALHISLIV